MHALRLLLGFFTTIPVGKVPFDESRLKQSFFFLPLIGLLFSSMLFALHILIGDHFLRGISLFVLYVLLSGGLHLDGYSDTIDGMFSRRSRPETLQIMQDPRLGTFAAIGLILLIMTEVIILDRVIQPAVLLFPVVGRLSNMLGTHRRTYARAEGLGGLFILTDHRLSFAVFSGMFVLVLLFLHWYLAILAYSIALIAALLCERWIHQRIGGMTGDTIGFLLEFSQLIYLLVLAWGY